MYSRNHARPAQLLLLISGMTGLLALPAMAQSASNQNNEGRQLALSLPAFDLSRMRAIAQASYQALQFQTAADSYRRICQFPGAVGNDYCWLGESYYHLNQYNNAAAAFQQALNLDPAADDTRVRLAQALLGAHQPQQARQICLDSITAVKSEYVRKQLEVLAKVCNNPFPAHPKPPAISSRTGHMEQ
jgi:tetratricopeptide (TPR) repeat protein